MIRVFNIIFDDRFAGPSKRIIQVGKVLAQQGIETVLCLPEGTGNASALAEKNGIPVRRIPFQRIPRHEDTLNVLKWFAHLPLDVGRFLTFFRRERPDIVHINGAFFIAPALAAKTLGIPVVFHLNDTIVPKVIAPAIGRFARLLASRIVVAAEAVACHYGLLGSRYKVIYAPVDVLKYRAVGNPSRGEGGQVRRIGLIANWTPIKGIEYYMKAAALVRKTFGGNIQLVFAGAKLETQMSYRRRIESIIESACLKTIICDHGFLPSVAQVLAELDVLVLSSITEACPMVVLEAMATGVPVVATDVGGVREIVLRDENNPAGIVVPPADIKSMASAIESLLKAPDLASEMGRNGRRLAEKVFSLDICAQRHLGVYHSLIGR